MTTTTITITPAYLARIHDGFELANMIHEAAFDALTMHKIPFDPLVVHTLIAKITTALADECDTGTTAEGDVYHLVPVTTYIPNEKAAAA
jgi:hypothetical protein